MTYFPGRLVGLVGRETGVGGITNPPPEDRDELEELFRSSKDWELPRSMFFITSSSCSFRWDPGVGSIRHKWGGR